VAGALGVLVAAGRASWEPAALRDLAAAGMVVLRRCVDLDDLLATALQGQAELALVSAGLTGLDADAVRRLGDAGLGIVAVEADPAGDERTRRLGLALATPADVVARLREVLATEPEPVRVEESPAHRGESRRGSVVAVWGPTGAPGRTTIASALAAELASGGRQVVLADVDPCAGTIAQQLGVVEDVSGLLAVARLANEGALDHETLTGCLRRVAPGLDVLTGLPRAERWREVREGVVADLVELAREEADVVLDGGFALDAYAERAGLPRPVATLEALHHADAIVVVGSAEPAGLTRLARGLVALTEVVDRSPAAVVVNRMRGSLGWREADVAAMVDGFAPGVPVCFWPEERALLDRALVSGRSLVELGEHALRGCARDLVDVLAQVPKSR